MNERELSALKAVIKCVEEHKLEEQFPLDSLLRRVPQLEKTKADKKQASEVPKPQSKRARATNTAYGPRMPNMGPTNSSPYAAVPRPSDRYPPPQYVFDNRSYGYPTGHTDNNHCAPPPPVLGAPAYGFLSPPPPPHPHPGHGNYYTNAYQYQQPPTYFH